MSIAALESFTHKGRRIAFQVHGSGPRPIVLTHGLLMDMRMYTRLIPTLVKAGYRVITVDMLGHGASDHPHDMTAHSMPQYGRDVVALLDHLEIAEAVIGGTSLGANVSLEVAVLAPSRVRGLVVEMPVLEHGIAGAAAMFVPLALALRVAQPGMRWFGKLVRKLPRSHFLVDVLLDFVRRDPASSLAVLDGITFGEVAPHKGERLAITLPTLVVGHKGDAVHPFSDADKMAAELPNARLVIAKGLTEWRLKPARLDAELLRFLDEVWSKAAADVEDEAAAG